MAVKFYYASSPLPLICVSIHAHVVVVVHVHVPVPTVTSRYVVFLLHLFFVSPTFIFPALLSASVVVAILVKAFTPLPLIFVSPHVPTVASASYVVFLLHLFFVSPTFISPTLVVAESYC